MKQKIISKLLALAFMAAASAPAFAADMARYMGFPDSKMRIDGTSTIHDWHAETKLIGGSFLCDKAVSLTALKTGKLNGKVAAVMRANSFACSSGSAMDKIMRAAMNADKHPLISFASDSLEVKSVNQDGTAIISAKGDLTVSGVKKPLTLEVKLTPADEGKRATFSGKAKVKMTDHGIKPPAPAVGLGLIKTGDEVTMSFEWKTIRRD